MSGSGIFHLAAGLTCTWDRNRRHANLQQGKRRQRSEQQSNDFDEPFAFFPPNSASCRTAPRPRGRPKRGTAAGRGKPGNLPLCSEGKGPVPPSALRFDGTPALSGGALPTCCPTSLVVRPCHPPTSATRQQGVVTGIYLYYTRTPMSFVSPGDSYLRLGLPQLVCGYSRLCSGEQTIR